MSFQPTIDLIKEKASKTPEELIKIAKDKGLLELNIKAVQIIEWLKVDFNFSQGQAVGIYGLFKDMKAVITPPKISKKYSKKDKKELLPKQKTKYVSKKRDLKI